MEQMPLETTIDSFIFFFVHIKNFAHEQFTFQFILCFTMPPKNQHSNQNSYALHSHTEYTQNILYSQYAYRVFVKWSILMYIHLLLFI